MLGEPPVSFAASAAAAICAPGSAAAALPPTTCPCPPLYRRLACSTVCKRWHTATLSPPLLDQVAIKAGSAYDDDPGWLATLCSSTAWLLRRAACSVRQLSLEVHTASDTTNIEHAVAAALVQGTLATVAEAGELRELSVVSPNLPVILGSWAASLCHLQRLSIDCFSCPATIDADLSGLTALQSLRLDGCCSHLTPAARLPTTLTSLYLGTNLDDVGEPVNEELPDQVGRWSTQRFGVGLDPR